MYTSFFHASWDRFNRVPFQTFSDPTLASPIRADTIDCEIREMLYNPFLLQFGANWSSFIEPFHQFRLEGKKNHYSVLTEEKDRFAEPVSKVEAVTRRVRGTKKRPSPCIKSSIEASLDFSEEGIRKKEVLKL